MKKIAVYFDQAGALSYPLDKQEYWNAYQELSHEIHQLNSEFFVVRGQDSYLGDARFSKSWRFHNQELVESGAITVDCLYVKGEFVSDGNVVLSNSPKLHELCTDKWQTYHLFKEFCPFTQLAENEQEFLTTVENIQTEKVVIKPRDQGEGKDVFIGDRKYILALSKKYPVLVQEFIDSSQGISGLVHGIHDLRVGILNGEIVFSFIRTPPEGELRANIALGGTLHVLEVDKIPEEAYRIALAIDKKMARFGHRFYGIDMAHAMDGFKLIELNSKLGLQENSRHEIFVTIKQKLAEYLVSIC